MAWGLAVLGYFGLALVLTWPLALHLGDAVTGIPWVDQMDTAWLRLADARAWLHPTQTVSTEILAPTGYPLGALIPNHVDHLLGAPLALLLPWPLSDNLWWLGVLAANGLAGHVLGRHLGGSHGAGALCGVAFACAEPILREANLTHAPQALVLWAPLYTLFLVRALAWSGRWRDAVVAGLFLALSGLTWWYQAVFLGAMSVPVVIGVLATARRDRVGRAWRVVAVAAVALALVSVPLGITLMGWSDLPRTDPALLPPLHLSADAATLPARHQWTFAQAGDVLWDLRPTPLDRSNRLSLALVGAVVVGATAVRRTPAWVWLAAAAVGVVFQLGPYLKLGEDLFLGMAIPLPGWALAEVSDLMARLHWPQRWGFLIPLALLPLAARARAPWAWAVAVGVEALLLSGNAPLALTPVHQVDGWRALAATDGAVLVAPLDRVGPYAASSGFIYRACGRPLATSVFVAEGAPEPTAWRAWRARSPFARWQDGVLDGRVEPLPDGALEALRADGIGAIALDATPGGLVPPAELVRYRGAFTAALGEPVDYGSAIVWWVDRPDPVPPGVPDGDAWRAAERARLAAWPRVRGRTLFPPLDWGRR